jgi:hypothetical protein
MEWKKGILLLIGINTSISFWVFVLKAEIKSEVTFEIAG